MPDREMRFDDDWFMANRYRLLEIHPYALEERRPHAIHTILHEARLGGGVDPSIDDDLRRLPPRHACAVRAHMQFYRACLTATGLVPADALVKAAVQIEWFWYNTAFNAFYRDHIAHMMKVATLGLTLLEDEQSPFAHGGAPLIDVVARKLAAGKWGSPAIRAAARRAGNRADALRSEEFWRYAVLEAVRLAALLHDMAHPAIIASKMIRIAAPVRAHLPFEPSEEETHARTVSAFGHSLFAAPFNRGVLPDSRGLGAAEAQICGDVFQHSHSLRAACAIALLADEADRVWQLSSFDMFVMEWAALAVSLHDYDKLLRPVESERQRRRLTCWLDRRDAQGKRYNRDAMRPSFASDPVSYMVTLADQMQEFGRVLGPSGDVGAGMRYPCQAVTLRVGERRGRTEADLCVLIGADESREDFARIEKHKQEEAARVFGDGGGDGAWLDSAGLVASIRLEVKRAAAPQRAATPRPAAPVQLFYSFADEDLALCEELEAHLRPLHLAGEIAPWHRRSVGPGGDVLREVDEHLRAADLVLILISADLCASSHCYGVEVATALARHRERAARVIPIRVRSCDLRAAPQLDELEPLPSNRAWVASSPDRDDAWTDVAQGIRRAVQEIREGRTAGGR